MPQADTAYTIGVIREKENELLEEDEFVRLIEAKSKADALRSVAETTYGRWLEGEIIWEAVDKALDRERLELFKWIGETANDEDIIRFIGARFDGLNAALAVLQNRVGSVMPEELSPLGRVERQVWQSVLDNDLGWKSLSDKWRETLEEIKEADNATIAIKCGAAVRHLMKQAASGKLLVDIAHFEEEKAEEQEINRPTSDPDEAEEMERRWDEKLMELIRPYKFEPEGNSPIVAFWWAKELEIRNIRLLLAGKLAGQSAAELYRQKRSLYRQIK